MIPTHTNHYKSPNFHNNLQRRYRVEKSIKLLGKFTVFFILAMLCFLLGSIFIRGYTALWQTKILIPITYNTQILNPSTTQDPKIPQNANYSTLIVQGLRQIFPQVTSRRQQRQLYRLISQQATYTLEKRITHNPQLIGTTEEIWLLADDQVDQFFKGNISCGTSYTQRQQNLPCTVPEKARYLKDQHISWIDTLITQKRLQSSFNTTLFTSGDSRHPEQAGVLGGLVGSLLTLMVCLIFILPIGVLTAVYLEEFAPKNRITRFIEITIDNLMAIPSIVFGLLGLAIFLNVFGLPRSAPLVGGLVLGLMTLPIIVTTTRISLRAVPHTIRTAALGLGASQQQTVFDHVLPVATPGILTGTIIGLSQALGETAPLLMIGMVAFIVDIPQSILEPATVLPVQIYIWSDSPERGFIERTSAAIMVLLTFLLCMNALAIYLRKRFERRW